MRQNNYDRMYIRYWLFSAIFTNLSDFNLKIWGSSSKNGLLKVCATFVTGPWTLFWRILNRLCDVRKIVISGLLFDLLQKCLWWLTKWFSINQVVHIATKLVPLKWQNFWLEPKSNITSVSATIQTNSIMSVYYNFTFLVVNFQILTRHFRWNGAARHATSD